MLRFQKYVPNAKLKEYIHFYFVIEMGKAGANNELGFMTNHPQGTFDLMFALRGGIQLSNFKDDQFQLSKIFVMAQQEGFFNIQFRPDSYIFGVVFYAESFSKLFNFPLKDLTNTGMRVDDHLSTPYHELYDQLSNQLSDVQRAALMDEFIEGQLMKVDFSFTRFDELIRTMRSTTGPVRIDALADQSNMSPRTLQRKMKEILGVTPKSYSKVIRFKEVLKFISDHPTYDWQDILFQCGYYDQAHFIKDFKQYTGKTPQAFLRDQQGLSSLFLSDEDQ